MSRFKLLLSAVLLVAAGLLASGCEEAVDPVLETEKAYTLYGLLTPQASVQKVVVYPIRGRLAPLGKEPLEATVTATDLTAGMTYSLRDSAFKEAKDQWAHAFIWPGRAPYGHTYRIEASGPKGRTSVTVSVPREADLTSGDPDASGLVTLPARVTAPVPHLLHVEAAYRIQFRPGPVDQTTDTLYLDYDNRIEETATGWRIPIELTKDAQALARWCQQNRCWPAGTERWGILLLDLHLRLAVVNDAWDPPGSEYEAGIHEKPLIAPSFDPEALVQPGTFTNVDSGFGFVGAGYRLETCWEPERRDVAGCPTKLDRDLLWQAGFRRTP